MKEFLYKLLDILVLGKGITRNINGCSIRLPTRYFRYFKSDYEKDNFDFLKRYLKDGMYAIDIGAHIGLLTIFMAKLVGRKGKIFSFEPTPSTFKLLKKTISINDLSKVVILLNKAVSKHHGKAVFYATELEAHNSNSLVENTRSIYNENSIEVEVTSVDYFVANNSTNIDLIKIDAEGVELSVLTGAYKTIEKYSPNILLALHPNSIEKNGDSLLEIWNYISQFDYTIKWKGQVINKEKFCNQTGLFDVHIIKR
ncbi:MAG: hypothetical protein COA57_00975 [Flavobacteriales bacterium]|nr:MAG: hypothetical protein COA57_00975 [Flavobacteriales bacterium]